MVRRVRQIPVVRAAEVKRVQWLTPRMRRVVFAGQQLSGFDSPGFDDHVKLFLPAAGEARPNLPTVGPSGIIFPEGRRRPIMRDFTPRSFNNKTGELVIDFAIHASGPATDWASSASPGMQVGIGGPRGSSIIPVDFDIHILIGDETALPAISRRLEELPASSRSIVVVEVDGPAGELELAGNSASTLYWVHRRATGSGPSDGLLSVLRMQDLPLRDSFTWIACESSAAKDLRNHMIRVCGARPDAVKASGYWRSGEAAMHDVHDAA